MKNFINPHWNNDENIMMNSAAIGSFLQPGELCGECVLHHSIRIVITCADRLTLLHEKDSVIKQGQY